MTLNNNENDKKKYTGAEKPCPSCGKALGVLSKKCHHCGKVFNDEEIKQRINSNFKSQLGCLLVLLPIIGIGYFAIQPSAEEKAAKQAELALEREKGFHCLNKWDGAHDGVKTRTKASLRDPDSFEHIETRVTPRKKDGNHGLIMKYRARNGFGGVNVGEVYANFSNADCSISTFNLPKS